MHMEGNVLKTSFSQEVLISLVNWALNKVNIFLWGIDYIHPFHSSKEMGIENILSKLEVNFHIRSYLNPLEPSTSHCQSANVKENLCVV